MKILVTIFTILFATVARAQSNVIKFERIDAASLQMDASSIHELATKLTVAYNNDLDKTRSIFSWVAQHIRYEIFPPTMPSPQRSYSESLDTLKTLPPLVERVSEDVFRNRHAVCYGFANLFKCLCDYAGIQCEIINGYARGDYSRVGKNFHTNHTWNAVKIDSSWHLIDVAWASGYFAHNSNQFTPKFDDEYFMMRPEEFAHDHYPDDLRWALLSTVPVLEEFATAPYKGRCYPKYAISGYSPQNGIIKTAFGDTLRFHLNVADNALTRITQDSSSPKLDALPGIATCLPDGGTTGRLISYTYVVPNNTVQWLELVLNGDVVLRYKIEEDNNLAAR